MSRSSTTVIVSFVIAISTALWIGRSLAQQVVVERSTTGTSNLAARAGFGPPESPWPSAERDSLRQADQKHAQATRELVAKYKETQDSEELENLREELNQVVTEHFEVRQQMRTRELEELEAQIRRLRELHDRREEERDQIIGDRVQQLLRDAEGLGWGADQDGVWSAPAVPGARAFPPTVDGFVVPSPPPTPPTIDPSTAPAPAPRR